MLSQRSLSRGIEGRRGMALVIVLAFVVMLTGLLVAFFSRSLADRQVSTGSANETKVDLFARGALDSIVGDFKDEIAAGSDITTTTVSGSNCTTYVPATSWSAVPCQSGTTVAAWLPPNVLKRSANGQPFYNAS